MGFVQCPKAEAKSASRTLYLNYSTMDIVQKKEIASECNTPLSKHLNQSYFIFTESGISSCDAGTLCVRGGTAASAHAGTHKPNAGDCQHEVTGACQKAG
jgi:hypothetical protein